MTNFGYKDSTSEMNSTSPEHWVVPFAAVIKIPSHEREQLLPRGTSEDNPGSPPK